MSDVTVTDLVSALGDLKKQSADLYKQYKEVKNIEDIARNDLIEALRASGMKSVKTDKYMASMAYKPSVNILHEQSVIDWLKETPNIETDQYIGLKKTEFKTLALAMLKGTGEVVPGTELVNTESLSIRSNK